jgi:hypothetical protein
MSKFKLNKNDYLLLLKYYNINSNGLSLSDIKNTAENILANKLCRCIKKVDNYYLKKKIIKQKKDIIGICKNSVITKKNLQINKFKCKKKPRLLKTKKKSKIFKTLKGSILK